MLEEKSYFTIDDMKTALSKIISQIESSNFTPEIIFSINRGGCIPGVYLSHAINVQHKVIDVQLRDDTNSPNLEPLTNIILVYNNILIIDDINDTGSTFNFIKKSFKNHNNKLYYASLIENKTSSFKVNFFGKIIDKSVDPKWIVFPWEE
jgi:hypoxanthine phosphoribosyltransferase|tara:strand:+ start:772 stop:1221 length:450 start_codon:yes stop_codon:yes gene_type:complete